MNDFTKEELKSIYYHMENEPIELMNKIKSMVDNYCEHVAIGEVEEFVDVCGKCNKFMLRETHYE